MRRPAVDGRGGAQPVAASYLIRSVVARLPGCVSATGEMVTVPVLCGPAGAPCLVVILYAVGGSGRALVGRACPLSPSRGPHGRMCVCWAVSFALIAGGHTPVMYSHECVCT